MSAPNDEMDGWQSWPESSPRSILLDLHTMLGRMEAVQWGNRQTTIERTAAMEDHLGRRIDDLRAATTERLDHHWHHITALERRDGHPPAPPPSWPVVPCLQLAGMAALFALGLTGLLTPAEVKAALLTLLGAR